MFKEKPPQRRLRHSRGSSAERGDVGILEIRRKQASADQARKKEIEALIERAREAEQSGKGNVARIFYQMAERRTHGEQRQELREKLKSIER